MKGVPIKFRVIDADENCKFIELKNIIALGYDAYISQLVGYDSEGNEVYEDDVLIDSRGNEFQAELWAMGVNPLDADGLNNGAINFTLKKG